MKKIMNHPDNIVSEMLSGFTVTHPDVVYHSGYEVISRKEKKQKVGVVSGGGSGHEPSHAGYVGEGMLDAAVAGNVFASPSPDRVLKGIQEADSGNGVLLIIKNYSGDVMNFEMAKELAEMEGIQVETLVVKDDVSVPDSTYSTGRRGIAGTVFIHKIAGAKAELGAPLFEVKAVAEKALKGLRSMGVALSACTLPGVGHPGFELRDDEIELGMGIHGEPGFERSRLKTARELAEVMIDKIFMDLDYSGCEVAVMVNGLGATPLMELYVLAGEVAQQLATRNVQIYRWFVGNYMTAIDMQGCSLSILKLDEELKILLDMPAKTAGLSI